MQANFEHCKAASGPRSARPFIAILASVPLIATLALCAPDRALAVCGAATHPAGGGGGGIHTGVGGGAHPAGGGGGVSGGGGGGCSSGSSALGLRGLPMAASGRVLAGGVPERTATTKRTASTSTATRAAPTRVANAGAHFGGVRPMGGVRPPRPAARR
jgi:hypothetical protein